MAILQELREKDFANNRVIKKGNIEIELSKDYPTEYYAFFIDMSKEGGELISVYADKNWNKVVKEIETFKYAKGGKMDEGGSIIDYNDDVYDNDYDNEDDSDSIYEIHFKPEDKEQSYQIYDKLEGIYVAGFPNEKGAIDWFNKNKGYYSY